MGRMRRIMLGVDTVTLCPSYTACASEPYELERLWLGMLTEQPLGLMKSRKILVGIECLLTLIRTQDSSVLVDYFETRSQHLHNQQVSYILF